MALRAGNIPRATALAEEALAQNVEHPGILNLAAHAALDRGESERAIALLERARELAPQDIHVLNSLGIALKRTGRFDEAIAVFDTASAAAPQLANAHYNKGTVFEARKDLDAARAAYERALALAPGFADALGRLSFIAGMRGDYEEACTLAERAIRGRPHELPAPLKVAEFALRRGDNAAADMFASRVPKASPHYAQARLTMAKACVGLKQYDKARSHLDDILARSAPGDIPSLALSLLGRIEEESGNYKAAFSDYAQAKAALDGKYASAHRTATGTAYADRAARLLDHFRQAPAPSKPRTEALPKGGPRQHVFLIGFPRSGTTVLEKSLAAHPDVVSLEEEESLGEAVAHFVTAEDGLARLDAGSEDELAVHRENYWRICRAALPGMDGKVFIDKMPLYSLYLPLVAKLFPAAKILFSLRDPRDVVLSCFKQQFQMSAAMYEFCDLARTARLYDLVMELRTLYRARLELEWLDTRYEDLVGDFAGTVQRVFAFLDVEWDESVRDVAASARARVSTTPSATQVARGLYDGSGQWRRYRTQLAPVLPVLQPWVEKFGYAPD